MPPENPPVKLMPYQFWATQRHYCLGFVLAGGFLSPPLVLISARKSFALNGYRRMDCCPVVLNVDVYAPIVGQYHHPQILQHLLPVVRCQVGILRHLFLDLVSSQLVLFAKGLQFKVVSRDAVFHQEVFGAVDATVRQSLVVFHRAAGVGMATEDQMGIRLVFQIICEVLGQSFQDLCLTVDQATPRDSRRWAERFESKYYAGPAWLPTA